MAIAYVNHTVYPDPANGSSYSFSHSTSGVDRLLVLAVNVLRNSGSSEPLISATYNGVSMTSAVSRSQTTTSRYHLSALLYLINPPTGSNTVAITTASTVVSIVADAMTFTGVHQTTPLGTSGSAVVNPVGATLTFNLTTTVINSYIVGSCMARSGIANLALDGAYTQVFEDASGSDTSLDLTAIGGYRATTSSGAYTFAVNTSGGNQFLTGAAMEIKPAIDAGATAAALRKIRTANRIGVHTGL